MAGLIGACRSPLRLPFRLVDLGLLLLCENVACRVRVWSTMYRPELGLEVVEIIGGQSDRNAGSAIHLYCEDLGMLLQEEQTHCSSLVPSIFQRASRFWSEQGVQCIQREPSGVCLQDFQDSKYRPSVRCVQDVLCLSVHGSLRGRRCNCSLQRALAFHVVCRINSRWPAHLHAQGPTSRPATMGSEEGAEALLTKISQPKFLLPGNHLWI
mmetsp:Transcript_40208/g.127280  ORF Transcript_40208/g.127280 Transcript_40208/m.127280 type:complete len:211 (-) Transcript_40208:2028-2660(-)